jgi:hypothetical protein
MRSNVVVMLGVETGDFLEHVAHLPWRKVRRAGERRSVRRQECGSRPSAHIVARVDVGTAVVVDPDRHEAAVNRFDNSLIGI